MVEPNALLVVEFRTGLGTTADVEGLNKLLQGEEFLLGAWVPAQKREEVDYGFGEISAFSVARRHFSRLWVVPFEWEDGKAQPVAVAF